MKHYLLICQVRSGYNFLSTLLLSHPKILALGEIFVQKEEVRRQSLYGKDIFVFNQNHNPIDYIENVLEPYAIQNQYEIFGFKLNYTDEVDWEYFKNKKWKIIHLKRENLLDRLISQKLSWKEENWSYKEYKSQITIQAKELELHCQKSMYYQKKVDDFFEPYSIFYEDLIKDTNQITHSLLKFLEISPQELKTPMKKQAIKNQGAYISNYRELYKELVFLKSPYIKYFNDLHFL